MKRFVTFFMAFLLGLTLLTAEEFTTGGVYVQVASKDQTFNLISQTTNVVEKLTVGKTYRLDADVMEIKTKEKESISLAFSIGLQVKVNPGSTFSVDSFNQLVKNDKTQPATLQSEYSVTALSLMDGEADIVCPPIDANSQCIVQTPLVNINLEGGKVSIKSNSKYVILNVIEGKVTVMDVKNNSTIIDKGQMGLIIPYPGRDNMIMVTSRVISPEELERVTKSLTELELKSKDVLFAVIDSKIVGINLK